jgi:type II secretory pathway pseudopilin PulG
LRELLVVMALIATLLILALPTIKDGLAKREIDRTMIKARELYLAGFRMATEGAAKSDASRAWPGDYETGMTSLADYCTRLVQGGYLKPDDLQRILNAPGAVCHVTAPGSPPTVTLTGQSALKVYKVKGADSSETIFSVSANYVYGIALNPSDVPFGDKGFVVIRKRGDAGVYRKHQATVAGWGNDKAEFHSKIGLLPGAPDAVAGDGGAALTGPQ